MCVMMNTTTTSVGQLSPQCCQSLNNFNQYSKWQQKNCSEWLNAHTVRRQDRTVCDKCQQADRPKRKQKLPQLLIKNADTLANLLLFFSPNRSHFAMCQQRHLCGCNTFFSLECLSHLRRFSPLLFPLPRRRRSAYRAWSFVSTSVPSRQPATCQLCLHTQWQCLVGTYELDDGEQSIKYITHSQITSKASSSSSFSITIFVFIIFHFCTLSFFPLPCMAFFSKITTIK